jgi:hypothetical protein
MISFGPSQGDCLFFPYFHELFVMQPVDVTNVAKPIFNQAVILAQNRKTRGE